jgi:hypothetical protein
LLLLPLRAGPELNNILHARPSRKLEGFLTIYSRETLIQATMAIKLSEYLMKVKDNSGLHEGEQLANQILFYQLSVIQTHIAVIPWIMSQIPAISKSLEI